MYRLIINICAKAALIMGVMMLIPAMCDLYVGDKHWMVFFRCFVLIIMISCLLLVATKDEKWKFSIKFGFLLTIYLWFLGIFIGALPFYFSHLNLSFSQSMFEATSTITTTGSTVLRGLDNLPPGILVWRSLLCWLGGVGVMGLTLLLLPNLRNDGVQFFNMEASYKNEKLLPRVNQVISSIVISYFTITLLCMFSYFFAGMSLFDAINHAMTTVATSGVSTHDASFAFFNSKTLLLVSGFFMVLGSLPITFYLKLTTIGFRKSLKDLQIITFLSIIIISISIITWYLKVRLNLNLKEAFYTAYFNFISLISTSGYTCEDYSLWGPLPVALLLGAGLIGGCSGSTAGGIKINRLVMLGQITKAHLKKLISPHTIAKCRYGAIEISNDVALSVLLFVCLYLITIIVGFIVLMCTGLDLISSFTGAIGALSNIGLGLGDKIGPTGNYAVLSNAELWIFSIIMLAGRLEIITLIIVLLPDFWKR